MVQVKPLQVKFEPFKPFTIKIHEGPSLPNGTEKANSARLLLGNYECNLYLYLFIYLFIHVFIKGEVWAGRPLLHLTLLKNT